MIRIIGDAGEFWRLRVTRLDASGAPDFEWRDDILYREPPAARIDEEQRWDVEAIRLDEPDVVVTVRSFTGSDEANRFLERARDDLAEMTKSQFEEAYVSPGMRPGSEDSTA